MSVRLIQLQNRSMNFDEIWHVGFSVGTYPKFILFKFPTVGNTNMADELTSEVGATNDVP
jgi:hypothetical protein